MKARNFLLLSLILLNIGLTARDFFPFRNQDSGLPLSKSKSPIGIAYDPHFVIKLNLTPLIFSAVSLQAEWAFHKKMSVALGASILPKKNFPTDIYNALDDNPYSSYFSVPAYEGKTITPEFRFYPFGRDGHSAPSGFYVAAYFRYANYKAYQNVSFEDFSSPDRTTYTARATHNYVGSTGGLMIGRQWIIGKHLSIDWWIVGGGYGKAKYTYSWQIDGVNLSDEQQAFVKDQANQNFDNFSFFGIKPNVQTTSNSAFMTAMVPMTSLRFMGLCVGFAF